jgi:hypothetical protein
MANSQKWQRRRVIGRIIQESCSAERMGEYRKTFPFSSIDAGEIPFRTKYKPMQRILNGLHTSAARSQVGMGYGQTRFTGKEQNGGEN